MEFRIGCCSPKFLTLGVQDEPHIAEEHLGLAKIIALEYVNIPGTSLDDVIAQANTALVRAAASYDSARGDFAPYAARAIRNALNSLYAAEMRHAKVQELVSDQIPPTAACSSSTSALENICDAEQDVVMAVRARESKQVLEQLIADLPKRSRTVVERIREGKSYQQIGEELGMSKQAAHKIARAALQSLMEKLERLGFAGVDSRGFLKTAGRARNQQ